MDLRPLVRHFEAHLAAWIPIAWFSVRSFITLEDAKIIYFRCDQPPVLRKAQTGFTALFVHHDALQLRPALIVPLTQRDSRAVRIYRIEKCGGILGL
jgi:hypothetical protein